MGVFLSTYSGRGENGSVSLRDRLHDYETIPEMTMDTLRQVMSKVVRELIDGFYDDTTDGMSDDEIVAREVDKLATDEVLKYINDNMKFWPVVDLQIGGVNYIALSIQDELEIGHGIEYVPKLFDEPACLLGEYSPGGGAGRLFHMSLLCMFVTASGEFKFADANVMSQGYSNSDELDFMGVTIYRESKEEYYGLELLRDIISDDYDGILYGWM